MPFFIFFISFFVMTTLFKQLYLANGLSTHCHFSTKLMLIIAQSSTTTQHLHSFEFTLVNKSHSQHFVVTVCYEGYHFLILYACAHVVSFPEHIRTYVNLHDMIVYGDIKICRSNVKTSRFLEKLRSASAAHLT